MSRINDLILGFFLLTLFIAISVLANTRRLFTRSDFGWISALGACSTDDQRQHICAQKPMNYSPEQKTNLTYRQTALESDMSKRSRKSRSKRHINVRAAVEQIHAAAEAMAASRSRYAAYDFLLAVYTPYWDWFDEGFSDEHIKSSIRRTSGQRHSHNEHPLKMLIRAARCSPEAKILSRWVRALEYALLKTIRPQHLIYFFEHHGGIAGCATLAAKMDPKRTPPPDRDDWADDSPVRHISES